MMLNFLDALQNQLILILMINMNKNMNKISGKIVANEKFFQVHYILLIKL